MGHLFRSNLSRALLVTSALLGVTFGVALAWADDEADNDKESRLKQVEADVARVPSLQVTMTPVDIEPFGDGGVAGECPQEVLTHSTANFGGGTFVIQAGFAEMEIAAAEYVVPSGDFPLRIDLMEMVFAQQAATVPTTTQWSVLVWQGPPDTGTMVASFSSDDVILPHVHMTTGTQGTNVQVAVDPMDPEQIIVNSNPSNSFTIGFRIDQHNNQTSDPCFTAPPANMNAFPTTDTPAPSQPNQVMYNWLFGVDCGILGCPPNGGWARFSALSNGPIIDCRPSGDWNIRVTYTPTFCDDVLGACCLNDGNCLGPVSQQTCAQTLSGEFQGMGSVCLPGVCPEPTVACCFDGNPPSCSDLTSSDCGGFGGTSQGAGSDCAGTICFPRGACCHPIGTCTNDVAQADCESSGGTFQGNLTQCSGVSCPQPTGACCSNATTFCSAITQASCGNIPNTTWAGAFTNCMGDADGDGEPDACEAGVPNCVTDLDCDDNDSCTCDDCNAGTCTHVEVEFGNTNCAGPTSPNLDDILCVLSGFSNFAMCPAGDIAPTSGPGACQGNDLINLDDILAVLGAFSGADPCNCVPQ